RAHDGLVEAELARELNRRRGARREVDDGVDALGLLLDLIGQTTASPNVDCVDGATLCADDVEELVEARSDSALVKLGVKNDHEFVLMRHKPTSFGLERPPSISR